MNGIASPTLMESFPRSISFEIVEEDSCWTDLSFTQSGITTMHDNDQQAGNS